jgi:NADH-quinone oxidoreductase subunit H
MQAIDRIFISIGGWFSSLLTDTLGVPQSWASGIGTLLQAIVVLTFAALTFLVLTYTERKIIARVQDRIGPNRVGPYGLLQPIADAIKMFTKEQTMPEIADKLVFQLMPIVVAAPSLLLFAVVPFGRDMVASNLDVGLIYVVAIGSIAEIGILSAGWASRNKFSLLGAMRAVAQMISYEIPMVLALTGLILMTGSLNLNTIVEAQAVLPFVLLQPFAFLIFLIAAAAETGRSPFDIIEAESEIVAGYHTEYAGMQFGLFQMGEFLGFYAQSAIAATLFLGGWQGPLLPSWLWFWLKTWFVVFIFQWAFRTTFPRLRIDQLQAFCWKFLVPAAVLNLLVTAFLVYLFPIVNADGTLAPGGGGWLVTLLAYLIGNVIVIALLAVLYRSQARRSVAQFEAEEEGGVEIMPLEKEALTA